MAIVEQVLEAEGAGDRQVIGFGKAVQVLTGFHGPAAAAQEHHGPLGRRQHGAQFRHLLRRWRRLYGAVSGGVGHAGALGQHVFGQRQHHRTGAAAGGDLEGVGDIFGNAVGAVDLRHPLAQRAEHAAIVDFLERFALDEVVADLADEKNHGRRVLLRRVHADCRIGGARAARDEADARFAGELAIGFGHEGRTAFLAVDDEADRRIVERIEYGEIALTGNAEGEIDAVHLQGVDEDAAARPWPARSYVRRGWCCCWHAGCLRIVVVQWNFNWYYP